MSVWLLLTLLALCGFSAVYGQSCSVEGQVRLRQTVSINLSNAGRVEICSGGVWGTIAVNSIGAPWSEKNAQVACIELGFSGALNSIFQRTIPFSDRPTSSTPINIINVACTGTESNITNCTHSTTIPQGIDHLYDAYVVCRGSSYSVVHTGGPQSGDIRLFGDARNGYGAVSIYSTTLGWLAICPDNSWTNTDATQICRELGYQGGSITSPILAVSGPGGRLPSRQLYAANCPASSGGNSISRVTIGVCSFGVQRSTSSCTAPEGMLAAVACSSVPDNSVRLFGGSISREGIVEIAYDGRWGVVCNDDFSTMDARAVCRGLGFNDDNARTSSISSSSVSNLQPIWLTELDCTATDRSLSACVREDDIIGFADCPGSFAGVDCGDQPLTGGQIAGIVVGVLLGVGFLIVFFSFLDVKNRQKAAKAYNNCLGRIKSIKCPSCPSLPRRERLIPPPAAASQPGPTQPPPPATAPAPAPTVAPGPQQPPPEPEPYGQEPEFTKVPPPSYQAAPGFPSQTAPVDAPPPYQGGPEFVYAPPSAPGAAAYPPPTLGFPPNAAPYPLT